MIIYGTKGTHLHSEKVSGVKCQHCEQQSGHTISIYGQYAYIYWIPIFPIGKKSFSECHHCKATFKKKEMDDQLKLKLENVLRNTKTPITHWIGLLIITSLIGLGFYTSNQHKKDVENYIAMPKTGDIVEYKSSAKAYSTLKITNVTTDSVFVVANSMEINRRSKLYKIDKDHNYNAERYGLSLLEYKNAFATDRFLDVDR